MSSWIHLACGCCNAVNLENLCDANYAVLIVSGGTVCADAECDQNVTVVCAPASHDDTLHRRVQIGVGVEGTFVLPKVTTSQPWIPPGCCGFEAVIGSCTPYTTGAPTIPPATGSCPNTIGGGTVYAIARVLFCPTPFGGGAGTLSWSVSGIRTYTYDVFCCLEPTGFVRFQKTECSTIAPTASGSDSLTAGEVDALKVGDQSAAIPNSTTTGTCWSWDAGCTVLSGIPYYGGSAVINFLP